MSNIPLSSIQELIERSLFESIRKELVDKGYLPNINSYPNTPAGKADYENAMANIRSTMGFAVEVFSESSNQSKGIKKVPRIIMKTGSFVPGALGGDVSRIMIPSGNGFLPTKTPPQTSDFYIDFHLVTENVQQERVLNALLAISVPRRGYVPFYVEPAYCFFVRYINYYNHDNTDQGIIEKVYAYEVQDCWEIENSVVGDLVAKMSDIKLGINLQKYPDGTSNYDADRIHIPAGHIDGTIANSSSVSGNLQEMGN